MMMGGPEQLTLPYLKKPIIVDLFLPNILGRPKYFLWFFASFINITWQTRLLLYVHTDELSILTFYLDAISNTSSNSKILCVP